MSNFTCAKPDANEQKLLFLLIRFGTCEVLCLNRAKDCFTLLLRFFLSGISGKKFPAHEAANFQRLLELLKVNVLMSLGLSSCFNLWLASSFSFMLSNICKISEWIWF